MGMYVCVYYICVGTYMYMGVYIHIRRQRAQSELNMKGE